MIQRRPRRLLGYHKIGFYILAILPHKSGRTLARADPSFRFSRRVEHAPTLRVYPRYTLVTEKLVAIISMGMANTRMKDYFDLWIILRDSELDRDILVRAVEAALNRRGTRKPSGVPTGLSKQFSSDQQKLVQWAAFINRNQLTAVALEQTLQELRSALMFLFHETHGG
ncbi:MAG: nucleotidyl transferase AbiEii/AbiGii toxin family protein [Deltaproteobacteria bacterium]|nr:nucleotidyl transferase AbiEii/AbiGii toxin family protein [Deltaproteobacteria bacterium]